MYTEKRGQITVFIIVGIIMLALTAGTIYLVNTLTKEKLPPPKIIEVQPVKDYIEGCLESRLEELLYFISMQGGYFDIPDFPLEYILTENISIYVPYYLYYSWMPFIDKSRVEEEISLGLLPMVDECTDLPMFPHIVSINTEKISITSTVNYFGVNSKIFLPVQIRVGDSIKEIDNFQIAVKSDIYKMYQTALNISYEQHKKGNELCLTCLSELINKSELGLDMSEIEGENSYIIIYTLRDPESDLIFNFAHKFNLSKEKGLVSIETIDRLEAVVGQEFNYAVKASGINLTFSDNSDLFDIDVSTGLIKFTPREEDAGTHLVIIKVEDPEGNNDEELFTLQIIREETLPQIEEIPYLLAKAGEPFSYVVKASSPLGLSLTFSDDSALFEIDQTTGNITFTPETLGEYDFIITVADKENNLDTMEGTLLVLD